MEINCYICKKKIICLCPNEQDIRPKERTCAIRENEYPQSMLGLDYYEIHVCSKKCHDKFNNEIERTVQKKIKLKKRFKNHKKIDLLYEPDEIKSILAKCKKDKKIEENLLDMFHQPIPEDVSSDRLVIIKEIEENIKLKHILAKRLEDRVDFISGKLKTK